MEDNKNLEAFNDAIAEEVDSKLKELSKYFDSIQVFATRHVDDEYGTTKFVYGRGNWFARYGIVSSWVQSNPLYAPKTDEDNGTD